ncbi:5072_t:CDS:2 [Cetraspora pellucida]|uniref:5072_t:CDS:1 n=1 Tax=Cetraspora pellucida TaxID=1433469 RepID=A0ACA9P064_9GLOM|nr:5072_t:CDS:2 [Cetraspora pellucida]
MSNEHVHNSNQEMRAETEPIIIHKNIYNVDSFYDNTIDSVFYALSDEERKERAILSPNIKSQLPLPLDVPEGFLLEWWMVV